MQDEHYAGVSVGLMGESHRLPLAAVTSEVAAGQVQRFVPKLDSWELLIDSTVPSPSLPLLFLASNPAHNSPAHKASFSLHFSARMAHKDQDWKQKNN